MKTLTFFALALLVACTQAPAQTATPLSGLSAVPGAAQAGAARSGGAWAVGTLATTGTCEMDVAADYTALISHRHRAARLLSQGRMTVDQAVTVQAQADSARADLDAACPNAAATLDATKRARARATLKRIAAILE